MIKAKPTENLTGVTIEGSHEDLYEMVESIYRMTGCEEDYSDCYWSVKNRLLGICYDLRHAFMGDREVVLVDNGVHDEMARWHSMVMPRKAVHFSVNVLFPEAVFAAFAVPEMFLFSGHYYGKKSKKQESEGYPAQKYSDYVRDKANLGMLSAAILDALAVVIGDEELEKLFALRNRKYGNLFYDYAAQYVDKCNIEYLKTPPEKRKDKLRNIARRLIQQPDAYQNLKRDMVYSAKQHGCSFHEMYDPRIEYPEDFEW